MSHHEAEVVTYRGGYQVTMRLRFNLLDDLTKMLDRLEDAGFHAESLDAERVTVTHVARRQSRSRSGHMVDHIAFYQEGLDYRVASHYLDRAADRQAFIDATGIDPDELKPKTGKLHPAMSDGDAGQYLMAVRKPVTILRRSYENEDGETRQEFLGYE